MATMRSFASGNLVISRSGPYAYLCIQIAEGTEQNNQKLFSFNRTQKASTSSTEPATSKSDTCLTEKKQVLGAGFFETIFSIWNFNFFEL